MLYKRRNRRARRFLLLFQFNSIRFVLSHFRLLHTKQTNRHTRMHARTHAHSYLKFQKYFYQMSNWNYNFAYKYYKIETVSAVHMGTTYRIHYFMKTKILYIYKNKFISRYSVILSNKSFTSLPTLPSIVSVRSSYRTLNQFTPQTTA